MESENLLCGNKQRMELRRGEWRQEQEAAATGIQITKRMEMNEQGVYE